MTISSMSGKIQTVLGTIDPGELGVTLGHEHLLVDLSRFPGDPADSIAPEIYDQRVTLENLGYISHYHVPNVDNSRLDDVQTAIAEARMYVERGGRSMIDATCVGIGRDPEALVHISKEAAPWYTSMWMPPRVDAPAWAASRSNGVSMGLYTRSLTKDLEGISPAGRGDPVWSGPWYIPTEVQLTISSAAAAASASSSPSREMAWASTLLSWAGLTSCRALSTVRLATVSRLTPALINANVTPLAAPPAPKTSVRRSWGSNPPASRNARRKPVPSVLYPPSRPSQ